MNTIFEDHDRIDRLERELEAEKSIVDRVWKALGITTYEQAKPFSIDEHVSQLRTRAETAESALKEHKSRIRLLGETLAEHVSEDFMEAHGLDWENWSSNNSVCTAPACGQPNPEPPYGEGGEEKP